MSDRKRGDLIACSQQARVTKDNKIADAEAAVARKVLDINFFLIY